jgi:hypothetical protein
MVQWLYMIISPCYHHMRHSYIWELNIYSNNQCKYKKKNSCNNTIQTFNIKPFNVLGLPSTILGCNANFLSNSNNWWFQYWHVWSKFNITKRASNLFGPLLNGTLGKRNHNNLLLSYWSCVNKCTHSTMYFKSYQSLLDYWTNHKPTYFA